MLDKEASNFNTPRQVNRMMSPVKLRYDPIEGWAILASILLVGLIVALLRQSVNGLVSLLIGLGWIPFSAYFVAPMYKRARRLMLEDATTVLKKDHRPPIIYLRPFTNDKLTIPGIKNAPTYEELLADALPDIGPFLAIGNPADELAQPGGHRMYIEDDSWQTVILDFFTRAQMFLASIGESEGFLWEIEQLVSKVRPERVILCFPICKTIIEKDRRYRRFRNATLNIFPHSLPEKLIDAQFLYFDSNWMPCLLTPQQDGRIIQTSSMEEPACMTQIEVLEALNSRFIPEISFYSSSHQTLLLLRYFGIAIVSIVSFLLFSLLIAVLLFATGKGNYWF